jgi:hypothetical protein
VQRGALAREQVVVEHLLHQRVAEPVGAAGLVAGQQVPVDRLAQQLQQPLLRHPRHGREQLVVDPRAGGRGHPQHALGLLWERLDPREQQVPDRPREAGAVGSGGEQLLGVEGVALRAGEHLAHLARCGPVVEDPGEQVGQLAAAEAAELQPLDPAAAVQLGEERAQRMAPVQLVAAVGEHQRRPGAQVVDQVAEQVAGRAVGPVQVLDDQQDRSARGQPVQHAQQQLEQAARSGRARRRRRRPAELRHQPGQLRPRVAEELVQRGGIRRGDQRPQRLDHRRVRQGAVAHVEAAADQHGGVGGPGPPGTLGDQPRLAHPSLARHHHRGGRSGHRPVQRGVEPGQLRGATHQDRAGDALVHARILPERSRAHGGDARTGEASDGRTRGHQAPLPWKWGCGRARSSGIRPIAAPRHRDRRHAACCSAQRRRSSKASGQPPAWRSREAVACRCSTSPISISSTSERRRRVWSAGPPPRARQSRWRGAGLLPGCRARRPAPRSRSRWAATSSTW